MVEKFIIMEYTIIEKMYIIAIAQMVFVIVKWREEYDKEFSV